MRKLLIRVRKRYYKLTKKNENLRCGGLEKWGRDNYWGR